jgi:hypothetical protein
LDRLLFRQLQLLIRLIRQHFQHLLQFFFSEQHHVQSLLLRLLRFLNLLRFLPRLCEAQQVDYFDLLARAQVHLGYCGSGHIQTVVLEMHVVFQLHFL